MNALSLTSSITPGTPLVTADSTRYQPGVCNIGPAEIAKRRRTGHIGVILTVAALVLLIAIDASPLLRFIVVAPIAAIAATGYLQAYLKFCAGFGYAGVFNFRGQGTTQHIVDREARARDRRRALQISAYSGLVGIVVGLIAAVLPI